MDWFLIISFFLSFIIGITIHETAHAWMGHKLGDPTAKDLGRISLNPVRHIDLIGSLMLPAISLFFAQSLMGWAKPTPYNPANLKDLKKDELLIALAGPVSNFLLASFCMLLLYALGFIFSFFNAPEATIDTILRFIYFIGVGNFILTFFNLLPIPPLDGSTFLKIFLPHRFGAYIDYYGQYGFIFLLMLSLTPAGNVLGNYLDTCVGFCLKMFGMI